MLFVTRRRPSCGGRTTAISGVAISSGERSCASLARTSGAADRSPPLQVRLKRCAYRCLSPTRHGHRLRTTTIPNVDGYFFARPNSRLAVAQPLLAAIDQKTIVIAVLRRRPPRWHLNADGALQPGLDPTQEAPNRSKRSTESAISPTLPQTRSKKLSRSAPPTLP